MSKQSILLDGEWQEAGAGLLKSLLPGVRKNAGVFETLRVSAGAGERLTDHFRRLCAGLKKLSMPAPWTRQELGARIRELLRRDRSAVRLRIMVWRDERQDVHWALVPGRSGIPDPKQYARGMKVLIAGVRRVFAKEDGAFKTLDYAVYRRAFARACRQGCADALLMAADGRIIDGSRASLVLLTGSALVIPPAGYGTFNGLTRRRVAGLARTAGLKIIRRPVYVKDLAEARAAWLCNSLIGMMPVRSWSFAGK